MKKMNIKDLYDYIISEMTAEEALLKLLEGNLVNYKKLKFNKGEEIHPLILILTAAAEMGWLIAIDKGNDKDNIKGLSVGTKDYMDKYFKDAV